MLLKVFPRSFYIYEYLILLSKVQKRKRLTKISFGDFSKSIWKKAWALNNEMPLSLWCTAGDLAWKLSWVKELQSRSSSQCWRQPHPRFAFLSLKWQLLGLVLTFNQCFTNCCVLMKLEIFCYMITAYMIHFFPR